MKFEFVAKKLEDYSTAAEQIVQLMAAYTVFILTGNLGAGKTTFVQKICKSIGTEDIVSSPTFALINPYKTKLGMIYHMDMYRISTVEEAIDFGIEEYLWEDHFCFIEWPERIESLLPDQFVRIDIEILDDHSRKICIEEVNTIT